jgi:phospholipase/carboxylesterase
MRFATMGGLDVRITGGTDGRGAGDGAVVVLMHGFGAGGDDLVPLGRELRAPPGTRFVFPAAPLALGSEFRGGRAWWWIDLEERIRREAAGERDTTEVPGGLLQARTLVTSLLAEIEGELRPPAGKLVLGGFSQGAMLALDVALHTSTALSALVVWSGTHLASREWATRFAARRGLPVLMSHGREDPLLPFEVSEALSRTMAAEGLAVEWIPFRGGHGIPPEVLARTGALLTRVL